MGVSGKLEKEDGTGGEQRKGVYLKANMKYITYITKSDMASALRQY